jgi:YHS domain-containing protein
MRTVLILGLCLAAGLQASSVRAADDPVYTSLFSSTAAGGYDVVSFFAETGPVEGKRGFKAEYNGANWRFATAANLALFQADPSRYAPQYGGYCAWAASQGYTASGDPEHWTLHDGKLFLNYNKSVKEDWLKDIPGFVRLADGHWPQMLE